MELQQLQDDRRLSLIVGAAFTLQEHRFVRLMPTGQCCHDALRRTLDFARRVEVFDAREPRPPMRTRIDQFASAAASEPEYSGPIGDGAKRPR